MGLSTQFFLLLSFPLSYGIVFFFFLINMYKVMCVFNWRGKILFLSLKISRVFLCLFLQKEISF